MLAQLCPVVAIICSGYGILSYYVPVQLTSVLTVTTNIACLLTNFLLHLLHHRSQSLVLIISYIFCFCLRMYNDRSFLFGLESDSRYGLSAASPKTVLSVTIPVTECFLTALSGLGFRVRLEKGGPTVQYKVKVDSSEKFSFHMNGNQSWGVSALQ